MGCSVQRPSSKVQSPILVTGASGYIASHCIGILLKSGYKVRGTVRSLANKEKYKFLYDLAGVHSHNLTLVEADLQLPESWKEAVKGCEYILHVASPIPPFVPQDENEVIKPAVEGTINVLNAALEAKCKKVVITSSMLAMWFGNDAHVINEEYWSKVELCSHYPKSKVLAEKAAWDFYEKHKDKIQMAVVNPCLVFGPTFTKHGNSSEVMMVDMLNGNFPGIPTPEITYAIVDVRDVAEGHIQALFRSESNGKRHLLAGHNVTSTQLIALLRENFEKYGYNLPTKEITGEGIKESGNKVAQRTLAMLGKKMLFNNERSLKELGLKYHKAEDTLIDMAYALIKHGSVVDKGIPK